MLEITWFKNHHENRNDFFQLGLLQLSRTNRIRFNRQPIERGKDFGLPAAFVTNDWRHASIMVVRDGNGKQIRVFIDNEDGFVHLHPLIELCDLYFCIPYVSAFHRLKQFVEPYPWQSEEDVLSYRIKAKGLIDRYGDHFGKIRRLCPTPTSLWATQIKNPRQPSRFVTKLANARHKAHKFLRTKLGLPDPILEAKSWESRWAELLAYRSGRLKYDVVSKESLWGWPIHRIRLHRQLSKLSDKFQVFHQLSPTKDMGPEAEFLAGLSTEDKEAYVQLTLPMTLPAGESFESAITQSRLAVFPTGYHWGWRGITFVSLAAGGPVLMDRPIYESYFDMDVFQIFYNDSMNWDNVEDILLSIDEKRWEAIRKHNQDAFDRYLTPIAAANYIVDTLECEMKTI